MVRLDDRAQGLFETLVVVCDSLPKPPKPCAYWGTLRAGALHTLPSHCNQRTQVRGCNPEHQAENQGCTDQGPLGLNTLLTKAIEKTAWITTRSLKRREGINLLSLQDSHQAGSLAWSLRPSSTRRCTPAALTPSMVIGPKESADSLLNVLRVLRDFPNLSEACGAAQTILEPPSPKTWSCTLVAPVWSAFWYLTLRTGW